MSYTVRCQFLEIYGEDIKDLLEPAGSHVSIREGRNGEVNVHGAKEVRVHGAEVRVGEEAKGWRGLGGGGVEGGFLLGQIGLRWRRREAVDLVGAARDGGARPRAGICPDGE